MSAESCVCTVLARMRTSPRAIDVDAERVLVLAVARVQVAAREDPVDVESDPLEGAARERDDVLPVDERVEVDGAVGRRLLEERIRVVPRAQLRHGATEPGGELLVERALPARERLGCDPVAVGQRVDQLLLVELVGRQRKREPVAVTERACSLVSEARELANVVGDLVRRPSSTPPTPRAARSARRFGGGSA